MIDKLDEGFTPFLGRLIVEGIQEDTDAYLKEMYGVSKNSILAMPDSVLADKVPLCKGKIVKLGIATFGDRFEKWYGSDIAQEARTLKEGDIVYFVPNQTYKLDVKGKYHIVSDEHVMGYVKEEVHV